MDQRTPNELVLQERDLCLNLWVSPTEILPIQTPTEPYTDENIIALIHKYVVECFNTEHIEIDLSVYHEGIRDALTQSLDGCFQFHIAFRHTFETSAQINAYKLKQPNAYRKFLEKVQATYLNNIYMNMMADSNEYFKKALRK